MYCAKFKGFLSGYTAKHIIMKYPLQSVCLFNSFCSLRPLCLLFCKVLILLLKFFGVMYHKLAKEKLRINKSFSLEILVKLVPALDVNHSLLCKIGAGDLPEESAN